MGVAKVKKIELVGLLKNKRSIIKRLQETGAVELIGDQTHEAAIQQLEYDIAQLDFAIPFIEKFYSEKISLLNKLRGNKIRCTTKEIKEVQTTTDHKTITEELTEIDSQLTEFRNHITKSNEEIEILTPWTELSSPQAELEETGKTGIVLGSFSIEQFEEFKKEASAIEKEIEISIVQRAEKTVQLMVVYTKKAQESVTTLLQEHGFVSTELPHKDHAPQAVIDQLHKDIEKWTIQITALEEKIGTFGTYLRNLKIVRDAFFWEKEQREADRFIQTTDKSFSIHFWVAEDHVKKLQSDLEQVTKNVAIEEIEITEGEEIPVPLDNSELMSPFESVTNIYGVPKSDEPDPTPLLAPFFVVYFGLALTDAAYGIILAIGAYLAIKILDVPKENRKLFIVLIWGGISTFIFGALFGGWFGIDLATLPPAAEKFFRTFQVLDSLAEPITVLLITMALGIFQIMVGIGIKGWWDIKQGKVVDAIMDQGTWLFFLGSAVLWILATAEFIFPASMAQTFLYLIYAALIAIVLTQGRAKKNIFLKLLGGIGSLYGLVGYFSDVLSYSRLLALGLSTAIIASVVNLVAFLFKDMMPWAPLGWVVAIVILVGGHIFNLAINVLGAYIHSGRLQFVEYFPKFMEGGGRRFKPFVKESKYLRVINLED